jgi:hypothetical protein
VHPPSTQQASEQPQFSHPQALPQQQPSPEATVEQQLATVGAALPATPGRYRAKATRATATIESAKNANGFIFESFSFELRVDE